MRSPYDAVIVDEMQDLGASELRLLATLAGHGTDRLILVGDGGQRIYATKYSLKSLGIDVRGRAHVLRLNYRTTEQIRRFADRILGDEADDLEGGRESRRGTVSLLSGPEPTRKSFPTRSAQCDFVAAQISQLLQSGRTPDDIAVFARLGDLATGLLQLEEISDDSIAGVRRKQERWEQLVRSQGYIYSRLWADAWCAAFVWKKIRDHSYPYPITEELFRKIERNPFHVVNTWHEQEIRRLAEQYQFFHWHLAFPDVFRVPVDNEEPENEQTGWNGGFDVVLGNPPWERVKLQEQEWFAGKRNDITDAPNATERHYLIESLKHEDPHLFYAWVDAKRTAEGISHYVRDSEYFPLCGRGDVNTYALFTELNLIITSVYGSVGCVVPTGIATDNTTRYFFDHILNGELIISLFDFSNDEGLFPTVRGHQHFCLLTLSHDRKRRAAIPKFAFFLTNPSLLTEPSRVFGLTPQDINLINPNSGTLPIFYSEKDAELAGVSHAPRPTTCTRLDAAGNHVGSGNRTSG
jgi:hypothetical protein